MREKVKRKGEERGGKWCVGEEDSKQERNKRRGIGVGV